LRVDDRPTLLGHNKGLGMNMVLHVSDKSWKSDTLVAGICIAVATRLQVQHLSFWLSTMSNTPSIQKNVTNGTSKLFPIRKCTFYLAILA
jgi:hypothetical protein